MHHTIVVYEVVLSMHRLVKKFGASLGPGEWDMVFSIVTHIDHHIRVSQPPYWRAVTWCKVTPPPTPSCPLHMKLPSSAV